MLVHFPLIKVLPENVREATDTLAGSCMLEYFLKARGICHVSLSESLEEPGKLLSLSTWDAPADAQAVFANPNYAVLVGELRPLPVVVPNTKNGLLGQPPTQFLVSPLYGGMS